jgi:hypothetical protein
VDCIWRVRSKHGADRLFDAAQLRIDDQSCRTEHEFLFGANRYSEIVIRDDLPPEVHEYAINRMHGEIYAFAGEPSYAKALG